ncbi:putative NEDD8-activating enzyme E1 catalytic subunit [Glarea lozoyensis 74030]|uniref:Putative NEDD8-activating enzyme E1 catalytic subunit n=1 Tax=Glarea lozoyensis (strain ATCC 74030 / MF5533) TaxID=1104152 RepID=H0ECW1_GLAL7|nr:putative NEDD8-activating enzyme E1 catalytic subunit [Glarea lozoyensis 74030]
MTVEEVESRTDHCPRFICRSISDKVHLQAHFAASTTPPNVCYAVVELNLSQHVATGHGLGTYLDNVRRNPGPFVSEEFTGSEEAVTASERVKVFGAGGLGCEILKNLALSGFQDIHVIDMGKESEQKPRTASDGF